MKIYKLAALFFILSYPAEAVSINGYVSDEDYFETIDDEEEKANLKQIEEAFEACEGQNGDNITETEDWKIIEEEMHKNFRNSYECYKNVVFRLIDTFQPRVADEVKKDFQAYLDAYDKMQYNQYYMQDACRGSCGTIIEDYIVVDRQIMIKNVAKNYIAAVSGYVNM